MIHADFIPGASFHPSSGNPFRGARVLLGLASRDARRVLTVELKREGYQVEHAFSAAEMKARLFFESFELVIYDTGLQGGPVLDALFTGHSPPVMIVAPSVSAELHAEAERLKAVLIDPFFCPREVCDCAVALAPPEMSPLGNPLGVQG